ncbi:hypothetical protein [Microseira sp. BLCC-F43]|uniref:hypothetical protein n=1 Tax=Microseira sp. BLCC-F43 TaxID=3153602 RepID=UPI0035BB1147
MDNLQPIVLSAALTLAFFWAIKINNHKLGVWIFLLLGILPLIFIYLRYPDFRVYDWHGFLHASIVYQIINGSIPPNNPILAGEPLLYPWGSHLLVASIVSLLHLSPATVFALLNLCFLALTLILVFKISLFLYSDRVAGLFAAFMSIFGITFVHRGPFAEGLNKINFLVNVKLFRMDIRATPVISKFASSGANNQFGILLFALFIYSILHIFCHVKVGKIYYFTVFISSLGIGFFYPIYLPAIAASSLACCAVIYFQQGRLFLNKILGLIACIVLSIVPILPYLHQITTGKVQTAAITLALFKKQHLFTQSFTYFITVLPVLIIIFWKRKLLLKILLNANLSVIILITIVVTTALMWIFMTSPTGVEYKYLILSLFTLGIFSSFCFRDLYSNQRIICFILLSIFLIPMSSFILYDSGQKPITDPYIEKGMYLFHKQPNENALYSYISSETKPDALFVDSYLTIPVFGRRQLYIGLDIRRKSFGWGKNDGWTSTAKRLLSEQGYPSEITDLRRTVASDFYDKTSNKISKYTVDKLAKISKKNDVYVVARDVKTNNKIAKSEHFNKVFESGVTAIYKFSNRVN